MSPRALACFLALASPCFAAEPIRISSVLAPALIDAVTAKDVPQVKELLAAGVPADSFSADGDTPLCTALRLGWLDIAKELLKHGADANAPGKEGQPPLILACLHRSPDVVKLLLDGGAKPDITAVFPMAPEFLQDIVSDNLRGYLKRERKVTPLMACAARGDVESLSLLMKAKPNVEIQTSPSRFTALDVAGQCGYLYVMRLLLGRDPDNEPKVLVTVNLSRQSATLEVDGKEKFKTSVSTGRAGYATKAGHYVVTQKYKDWKSTVYKVSMPFFMRLNCGDFGLHSGYVTGSPASHGCIRLPDAMARKFFDTVTVGDEVVVVP
jgi:hypothetical protein